MAPNTPHDDDFILTLSDREDDGGAASLEGESGDDAFNAPGPARNGTNGKKRKRGNEAAAKSMSKKVKKSSAVTGAGSEIKKPRGAVVGVDEEDEDEEEQGEADGVMDPSFEFEAGPEGRGGVVEDGFDAWEVDEKRQGKGGNKKTVDIEEIVERRRAKEEVKRERKEGGIDKPNGEVVGDGGRSSDDGEDDAGDPEEQHIPNFDDDELLAVDGFGAGADSDDEEEEDGELGSDGENEDDEEGTGEEEEDDASVASPVAHPDDLASDSVSDAGPEDSVEAERRKAFFAPEEPTPVPTLNSTSSSNTTPSFQSFSLSRPILKGVSSIGFTIPTPIQSKTIPVALLGKDVVGGAMTGSGKTAAFIIPILERLIYRPRKVPTSRVAILMPTRELAVQCFNVATKLASFTDVTFCQLVGGFSLREQENILKKRPDVIIATPGRFIDHMRNSASFTVDTLEILILDEADRMLEDGFADELNEILNTIPRSRQTMLFSATMTDSVDKLIRVGLNRPVRLLVDAKSSTVGTLVQEFVRLRPGREENRLAVLMLLCTTVYTNRVIIFFRQKKDAHRIRVIFTLCGLKAAELHGSMTQEQRISSVESFRSGKAAFLLATDLASRGLDIKGITTVINYSAPQSHEIYLHRVGRTARAGAAGRACTIASEEDRKVVKAAVRAGRTQGAKIVSRVVDNEEMDEWATKIEEMEEEVEEVLKDEKEEKQLAQAEMQVTKGENLIRHEDEIMARPKRTWFESEKEKRVAKKAGRVELNGVEVNGHGGKKGKGGKLSGKDKKRLDDRKERLEGKVWRKGKEDADAAAKPRGKGSSGRGRGGGRGGGGRGGAVRVGRSAGRRGGRK